VKIRELGTMADLPGQVRTDVGAYMDRVRDGLREAETRNTSGMPIMVEVPSITVYVSIGNSDDKLTQREWSTLCQVVENRVRARARVMHGVWYSLPNQPWQNACWCFEIQPDRVAELKSGLARACTDFGQDSIAWAVASTEFIRPVV